MSAAFDPEDDTYVGLRDELPLWSALAGALLLEHLPLDARRVLDVGCGPGFPALEIAERMGAATHVVGLDPWAAGLRRAAAKRTAWSVPNAAFVRGDGAAMPFRSGAFDLAVSNLGINNFADAPGAFAECRRVLAPGGALALTTNVSGHFDELYQAFALVLRGDRAAEERLRAHVAHRGSAAGLARALERHGFGIRATRERPVTLRFRDGRAVFAHHFIRLGFLPAWREVAGEAHADARLAALAGALDARAREAGGLTLTVPLVLIVAEAT